MKHYLLIVHEQRAPGYEAAFDAEIESNRVRFLRTATHPLTNQTYKWAFDQLSDDEQAMGHSVILRLMGYSGEEYNIDSDGVDNVVIYQQVNGLNILAGGIIPTNDIMETLTQLGLVIPEDLP